jgi:hypothetical protein
VIDAEEPWWVVRPPRPLNGDLTQVLASVDALQAAWAGVVRDEPAEVFQESRYRSLRRHAIETGIIERLYDVDWGVTEALVAEGLSAEVAAREGGIDDGALATIRAQFDALTMLVEAAGDGRPTTAHFIREVHAAICRTQTTFDAVDQFGRPVIRPLRLGSWKEMPNQAHTRDGAILDFAPPEQVEPQIERLIELSADTQELHPLVAAAWLHHSFVAIHPFDDGNGRVARALTLLALLRKDYAPLVVDRFSRGDYLAALESANHGELQDLVRLFARLEMVALRSELERPAARREPSGAVDVAKAFVERIQRLQAERAQDLATAVSTLAAQANEYVVERLRGYGTQLTEQFRAVDATTASAVYHAEPPDERARWWRAQIIRAARRSGFFANLSQGAWWAYLRLTTLSQQLRFVVAIQRVGHGETGVLALTVLAEAVPLGSTDDSDSPGYVELISPADEDSVTLVAGESLETRTLEIDAVLDRTLAAAIAGFAQGLG